MDLTTDRPARKAPAAPPPHPLWGHVPGLTRAPLAFLTDCARNYGPVVPLRLLFLRAVLLLDPADIERVLVTEHRDFIKPVWLRTASVRRLVGNGLLTSEGSNWRQQRHACQPAFHLSRMDQYGRAIAGVVERTLRGWEAGQTRSLQRDMSHLTLEIIARTLFDADAPGWMGDACDAMDTMMARFTSSLSPFGMVPLPPAVAEMRAERKLDRVVDLLLDANASRAGKRIANGEAPDLLTLLRAPVEAGGEGLAGRLLKEQVKTFLSAGYESSALALTWAFLLLAQNPGVEEELARELASVLGDRAPAPGDVPNLPYTQAIVKETLRLFPPLWMTGRQAVRRCEIGGITVAAGTIVMTSQWAVQRLPRYYADPDAFRPERWLNGETRDLPRHAYFPFGGGPRVCIGQSFAMLESVLLLAAVAQRFRLMPLPGPEIRPWATMTLRPPAGVMVQVFSRR